MGVVVLIKLRSRSHIKTVHAGCHTQLCSWHIPRFLITYTHCWGSAIWSYTLSVTCRASPRSLSEEIRSTTWLYWVFGGKHTIAVSSSSSGIWLVQPEVMMIVMIADSAIVKWSVVPGRLCGQLAGLVQQCLPSLSWIHQHNIYISWAYNTILKLCWDVTSIIFYHLYITYTCSNSHYSCLHPALQYALVVWTWVGVPGLLDQTVSQNCPPLLTRFSLHITALWLLSSNICHCIHLLTQLPLLLPPM